MTDHLIELAARAIFETDEDINDEFQADLQAEGQHMAAEALGPRAQWDDESSVPIQNSFRRRANAAVKALRASGALAPEGPFVLGQRVRKRSGSSWQGRIVGWYSTRLTPIGYAVESDREPGSVQIYPAPALEPAPPERAG